MLELLHLIFLRLNSLYCWSSFIDRPVDVKEYQQGFYLQLTTLQLYLKVDFHVHQHSFIINLHSKVVRARLKVYTQALQQRLD